MPKRFIIGNWKMNTTLDDARALMAAAPTSTDAVQVGIAPPYPWIVPLRETQHDRTLWLGAQAAVPQPAGAFTGDVSVAMIAPYTDFLLVGHSEQRQHHPAPAATWRQTVEAALAAGLAVVLCVGESLTDRDAGRADAIVTGQLADAVAAPHERLIVAYEPVWAIGTGRAASPADAGAMAAVIDRWLSDAFGSASGSVPILYGGSANATNAAELLAQPLVAGLLVGSASLDGRSFAAIVQAAM